MVAVMVRAALWHPFADMHRVQGQEVTLVRGDGALVWDDRGTEYVDASAGLWYCNVGHGREELAEAAATQMRRLASYQLFDVFATPPAHELADRLAGMTSTGPGGAVFFTSGGSDSVETAAKMARRFWLLRDAPERHIIVAREGAYHGMHGYGTSLAGIDANAAGWGALAPGVVHVPRHDVEALEQTLQDLRGQVAAFIGEPVQGAAGVHPPRDGYWSDVRRLCDEHDVLLIADEVVTGFGRLGTMFGADRYAMAPDMVLCAKGLSSGYLPIGAVVAGPRIVDALWDREAGAFRHGYTYSGHAAACAVALANLRIIERERLVERVASLEPVLARALDPLTEHPLVGEVRTVGLLGAVELDPRALATAADAVERVVVAARNRGVLVRNLLGRALQISPPFVVDEETIQRISDVVLAALEAIDAHVGAVR
jgi:putrescine---pyruvate transaminase